MDKIYNGNDYAKMAGYQDIRVMLKAGKYTGYDTPYIDGEPSGTSVVAYISFGVWIAECECRGAEMVAAGEPFYCRSCGNYGNGGKGRPVTWPDNASDIEAELLRRPVIPGTGRNELERLQRSRAAIHVDGRGWLARTWLPTETLDDLREQNKALPKKRRR
jgi:hypothetical protein